jgi:hypothetical protein
MTTLCSGTTMGGQKCLVSRPPCIPRAPQRTILLLLLHDMLLLLIWRLGRLDCPAFVLTLPKTWISSRAIVFFISSDDGACSTIPSADSLLFLVAVVVVAGKHRSWWSPPQSATSTPLAYKTTTLAPVSNTLRGDDCVPVVDASIAGWEFLSG